MPMLETYGAQPPIELLRQAVDQGGFYDRKKLFFKAVADTQYILACGPPGGGKMPVTPRFFRPFPRCSRTQTRHQNAKLTS